jgi:hypothetical protein
VHLSRSSGLGPANELTEADAMDDRKRFKLLHGPYKPPRCWLGKKLFCKVRGWVPVRRISAGRIPWPETSVVHSRAFILIDDLVKAVRHESAIAICHWWGVRQRQPRQRVGRRLAVLRLIESKREKAELKAVVSQSIRGGAGLEEIELRLRKGGYPTDVRR